jgi:hypothetical protein
MFNVKGDCGKRGNGSLFYTDSGFSDRGTGEACSGDMGALKRGQEEDKEEGFSASNQTKFKTENPRWDFSVGDGNKKETETKLGALKYEL